MLHVQEEMMACDDLINQLSQSILSNKEAQAFDLMISRERKG